MAFYIPRGLGSRFTSLVRCFAQDEDLPFASALTEEQIERVVADEGVNFGADADCVFTPAVVLWAFLTQCVSTSKSCAAAVARVIALRLALGLAPCSRATGAYCKARAKLPERLIRRLTYEVGAEVDDQAPTHWRCHNRRTLLVDGATVIADDTQANQLDYPQPTSQQPGPGFPIIRFVLLLAFATATVVGGAEGPHCGKETGETALFRELFEQLRPDDIVVADRYHCSYFMIALLRRRGVDAAFRLHHKRIYDFRRGIRLGHDDHIAIWHRPQRPDWMDEETYATMPATLMVREVRFAVDEPGCRSRSIIVATTLLNHHEYSAADIADLYHQRWHVELDLRSIKQTLKMEMIHCKTPAMVRRSLWMHLLGYNLLRKVAAQAAWEHNLTPRQISFAGAMHVLEENRWLLMCAGDEVRLGNCRALLLAIATDPVGDRPDRVEPRRLKRRHDKYPHLGVPRDQARAELLNGQE